MFVEFYGLHEDPFNLFTQRYLYLSVSHRNALSSLQYGIEYGGGVQLLLGGAGLGKTALLRYLEARQQTENRIIYLASTSAKDPELWKRLADSPNGDDSSNGSGAREPIDEVKQFDWQTHQRLVLLIDDAHQLNDQELTRLLGLAKRVAAEKGRLHLILAGRPDLLQKLKQTNASDSIQPIWLTPLGVGETEGYINYRLKMAAGKRGSIFTPAACSIIARQSQGVPRAINQLCAEALLTGARLQQKQIGISVFDTHESTPANGVPRVSSPKAQPAGAISPASRKPLRFGILLTGLLLIAAAALWFEEGTHLAWPVSAAINAASPAKQIPTAISGVVQGTPAGSVKGIDAGLQTRIQRSTPSAAAAKEPSSVPGSVIASPPLLMPTVSNRKHSDTAARVSRPISNVASASPRMTSADARALTPETKFRSSTPSALPPSVVKRSQTNERSDEASEPSPNPLGIVDPRRARVDVDVGDDYMRLGKYNEALGFYQDAIAFAPGDQRIEQKIRVASAKATEE